MDALCELSAIELRALIAAGEISPVELLEACLERIAEVNPALNAVVALDEPAARRAAAAAEAAVRAGAPLGLLHGLPIGIKDLNPTAGLRTTFGSPQFADHVPEADDSVVARIRAAGAVITAKTNTPEFGAGANTFNAVYGFTGNPFDPGKTCGGSSGGSAVALATGMFPLANGSDLGGSLRTPAAFCGVVGYRPTASTVANTSRLIAFSPLSLDGPMGRSVADTALLLAAMAGVDDRDPMTRPLDTAPLLALPESDLGKLDVALSEDLGFAPIADQVRGLFRDRAAQFSSAFGRCAAEDPEMADADRCFEVLRGVGFLAAHKASYESRPELLGPNVTANIELALGFSAADVAWASVQHGRIYRDFVGFMERHDLLICPAAAVSPFAEGTRYVAEIDGRRLDTYVSWLALAYGLTLTGHPVVVLPCGLDPAGMPFGIQLVGRRGRDAELLATAAALEARLQGLPDCRRPRPDLARLRGARPAHAAPDS